MCQGHKEIKQQVAKCIAAASHVQKRAETTTPTENIQRLCSASNLLACSTVKQLFDATQNRLLTEEWEAQGYVCGLIGRSATKDLPHPRRTQLPANGGAFDARCLHSRRTQANHGDTVRNL